MIVEREQCFDPVTQMNCYPTHDPNPLLPNRTVFFAVQPKYLNVDIRIILDVTRGDITFYFAPFDNVFVINVDPVTGIHHVSIDPVYRYTQQSVDETCSYRFRRDASSLFNTSAIPRTVGNSTANDLPEPEKVYELIEMSATQFVTFVTVPHPDMFLIVRNVQNRLIVILPNTAHQLKTSRFYVVLSGASDMSYGIIYFRQDQPHIDLFVFFSVFFSCFFLFLAACVLLWKVKQTLDTHRSRHRRQIEMQDMASRPFARALVYMSCQLSDTNEEILQSMTATPCSQLSKPASKYSMTHSDDSSLHVNPLALEPTESGMAVVATFMFQLPCSSTTPVRACLGSCLLTPRIMSSSLHALPAKNSGFRARTNIT
jgi:hypothetical protein